MPLNNRLLQIPAATSSITIPVPPDKFLSRDRIGYGFQISKTLNIKNPKITEMVLKGSPVNVTRIPATSSMTIQPGSSVFNIFSASRAIHMAKKIKITIKNTAINKLVLEKRKQSGSPRIDPNVPGAKEMFPIKQPVARNMTDFCFKFMACFYSLA